MTPTTELSRADERNWRRTKLDGPLVRAIHAVDDENNAALYAIPAIAQANFAEGLFAYRWIDASYESRLDAALQAIEVTP